MRPNGGILARGPEGLTIPILGITFYGATPTNSCEAVNATKPSTSQRNTTASAATRLPASRTCWPSRTPRSGYYYLHGDLQNASFDDALYQGS